MKQLAIPRERSQSIPVSNPGPGWPQRGPVGTPASVRSWSPSCCSQTRSCLPGLSLPAQPATHRACLHTPQPESWALPLPSSPTASWFIVLPCSPASEGSGSILSSTDSHLLTVSSPSPPHPSSTWSLSPILTLIQHREPLCLCTPLPTSLEHEPTSPRFGVLHHPNYPTREHKSPPSSRLGRLGTRCLTSSFITLPHHDTLPASCTLDHTLSTKSKKCKST